MARHLVRAWDVYVSLRFLCVLCALCVKIPIQPNRGFYRSAPTSATFRGYFVAT
jgi:hypothetical protein